MTFSHSGDIGDLLAALPTIKSMGGGELVLYPAPYTGWRMTPQRAESLRPFLELQPYISGVRFARHAIGTNLDHWRDHYRTNLNLSDMVAGAFGQPHHPREQPWLRVDAPNRIARVLFARSGRYRNPAVDWRKLYDEYSEEACFVGTPEEHHDFQRSVGPISFHYTPDYLELARVVAGADLICVNQTSIRWVAEGLKVPVVVEVDPGTNNTHFDRAGAKYLYGSGGDIPPLLDVAGHAIHSLIHRAHGHTLISDDRLSVIARLVRQTRHLPGIMAELGTYKGGSAAVIAGACPEKRLVLFDTWAGIPSDDVMEGGHKAGDFPADLEDVKQYLSLCHIEYRQGMFPATWQEDGERYSFVHLDGDTYQSTAEGLRKFLPKMVEGGVIVLDDYDWHACPGVRRACEEYRLEVQVWAAQQAVWRKK